MGKKNTNFRKLYLVDEDHYNSLQYGQVHDKHLKEFKALYETTNRPQPPPIQNVPPPTQNVPPPTQNGAPQQPDEPMDVDPTVNNPQQNMLNAYTQTLRTNNPVPFLGFVPPPQRTPLGTAIQRLAGPQIPDLGPPLQPRLPQTNNNRQVARFVAPSPSSEPKVELPPSPAPAAPLSLPGPAASLALTAPSAPLALAAAAGPFVLPSLPPPAPPGPYALPPLPPPAPSGPYALPPLPPPGVFALPAPPAPLPLSGPVAPLPLPAPAAPLPLPAPAAPLPLPAPAALLPLPAPAGPFAPAPGMDVDPSRGTRRARSPDTVGDNGSPIIGNPTQRRRYQRAIKPEPLSAPTVPSIPSEPSVSQQDVTSSNTLPSTRGRRARSEGDSSPTIDGRTARNDESTMRRMTPQPTVANASGETGARRRTYQRLIINPDEDFLRQNSRDTRQERPEIVWFTCQICNTSFRSERTLRRHMERMHREDLEQIERGEKRDGGDEEYGRNEQKYKRVV